MKTAVLSAIGGARRGTIATGGRGTPARRWSRRGGLAVWQRISAPYRAGAAAGADRAGLRPWATPRAPGWSSDAAQPGVRTAGRPPRHAARSTSLHAGSRRGASRLGGLTEREIRCSRLIATGKTNRAIAASCRSARRPSPGTSATSSPSSISRRAPRRPPTRTSTSWSETAQVELPTPDFRARRGDWLEVPMRNLRAYFTCGRCGDPHDER